MRDERALQRRGFLTATGAMGAAALVLPAWARDPAPRAAEFPGSDGRPVPMLVHEIRQLGIAVWTDAQPEWETSLQRGRGGGPPTFVVESPDDHQPPAVMTITAWRKERVPAEHLQTMAVTAIRTASGNYGVSKARALAIDVQPQAWGGLSGYQGVFTGRAQGTRMDVKVFVGQQDGKYPVVAQIYTLAGKMKEFDEIIRRCWSNINYL